MNDFLGRDFWGATVGDYLAFAFIVLIALLLKKPFSRLVVRLSSKLATRFSAGKYRMLFRSLIRKPVEWLFAIILFFYAFNFIEEPLSNITLLHWHGKKGESMVTAPMLIDKVFAFFAIILITLLISRIVDFLHRAHAERARHHMERERAQLLPLIRDVIKIVLWTIGFFWVLGSVFKVNIPALITGLGIGGVALALAAKESIENFFAAFTILADKPFSVDDTIKLGSLEGKVERIGFRATRLRTSDGSLLIIPNKKLVDENLGESLSARDKLHVRLTVPVKYAMPAHKIDDLLQRIREQVRHVPEVEPPVNAVVDAFTENTFVILLSYELPPAMQSAAVARIRAEVTQRVYAAITTPVDTPPAS